MRLEIDGRRAVAREGVVVKEMEALFEMLAAVGHIVREIVGHESVRNLSAGPGPDCRACERYPSRQAQQQWHGHRHGRSTQTRLRRRRNRTSLLYRSFHPRLII